jgi:hypothetical protein
MARASERLLAAQLNYVTELMSMEETGDYDVPGLPTLEMEIHDALNDFIDLVRGDHEMILNKAYFFTHERPDLRPATT